MPIIAFTSQCGGVGVTTSAVNVAHRLAIQGYATLLIDLQTLGQCALGLGVDTAPTVYEWLIAGKPPVSRAVKICQHLRLIRGNASTDLVTRNYSKLRNGREQLARQLRKLNQDDWIIIDTPRSPTLGEPVIEVADVVVIPFRGDMQSWRGVELTLQLLERVGSKARVILLPTLFDMRERLARQYLGKAESLYGKQVAHPIHRHIAVAQVAGIGRTIWEVSAEGLEDVRRSYCTLIDMLFSKEDTVEQPDETGRDQARAGALEAELVEAHTTHVQNDLLTRTAAVEAKIDALKKEINEMRQLLQEVHGSWERLCHLLKEYTKVL